MLRERIKELREDAGLKQEDIAYKLNIGRSTYANYESGATEPNVAILMDLSNIYNVSIDYICCNTDIKMNFYKDKKICKYINKCIDVYKEFLK
ncbi:helix-turn-helix domain-containing protein [Clostridium beijerinckii]|uniref:helix-turn-helix domain-containing protein n=1 Tax=Clostridium beijerinckii TaxID=1520 RepID=UPI00232B85B2|nr:helix-turn-helix transcriptional regulator [Clostridium beijerinckii]